MDQKDSILTVFDKVSGLKVESFTEADKVTGAVLHIYGMQLALNAVQFYSLQSLLTVAKDNGKSADSMTHITDRFVSPTFNR